MRKAGDVVKEFFRENAVVFASDIPGNVMA